MARNLEVQRFVQTGKQGSMRLVVSDATEIPFHEHAFDAVIAVHVYHLIGDWQKAIQEALCVLRPRGVLLRCWDEDVADSPSPWDIRREWSRMVEQLGGHAERPGRSAWHNQTVTAWLQQQGFRTESVVALKSWRPMTPRAVLEGLEQRVWSYDWAISDDIFAAAIARLRLQKRF